MRHPYGDALPMLLDIDLQTQQAVFHPRGAECPHLPGPYEGDKPLGCLGPDGGWFPATRWSDAVALIAARAPGIPLLLCTACRRQPE